VNGDEVRDVDPVFAGEFLYRAVNPDHVVNGVLLNEAIDVPACSFQRSKYGTPADALSETRPLKTLIYTARADDVPCQFRSNAPGASAYEFYVADAPNEGIAHCEVRVRRPGKTFNPKHKMKPAAKMLARKILCSKMAQYSEGDTIVSDG